MLALIASFLLSCPKGSVLLVHVLQLCRASTISIMLLVTTSSANASRIHITQTYLGFTLLGTDRLGDAAGQLGCKERPMIFS